MEFPKIDKIANLKEFEACFKPSLMQISKKIINDLRDRKIEISQEEVINLIKKEYENFHQIETRKIINATGIVIHTNLGRSPISDEILDKIKPLLTSYSNLEFNMETGKRGERYTFSSELLKMLFGVEDALIVNNNAAAVFLILNTFANNKEVIVSRGELIEIGGSFRIPEVMKASGSILREVGTTNKTKITDYENDINEKTSMLLKVHKSNYDIVGFTKETSINEISKIAKENNIISYYDLGSGYTGALPFSLGQNEPSIENILKTGVDLISFSGDKLLGSAQAGIILGKKELINKLKKNQILRMLRVDKLTISIINETLKAYLDKNYAILKAPNQIHLKISELEKNAKFVLDKVANEKLQIVKTRSFVGGGALPNKSYPSIAIKINGNAEFFEKEFRKKDLIGRIENGGFLIDFRSVFKSDLEKMIGIIKEIL